MAESGFQGRSLRILLIGRTGDGKSSTGNSILGKSVFKTLNATTSVTQKCEAGKEYRFGRSIEVVDTPGIFDTQHSNSQIHKELLRALCMTMPGFHAIIYVMRPTRFTEEAQTVKRKFFEWFGDQVSMHLILVITWAKTTEDIKQFLESDPHPEFKNLVEECKNRIVLFDNTALGTPNNDKQVKELLSTIDETIVSNNNRYFTNELYKIAEIYARDKLERKLSKDSIRILQNAGLSKDKLENKYGFILENANDAMCSENLSKSKGNVRIYDVATDLPYTGYSDTDAAEQNDVQKLNNYVETTSIDDASISLKKIDMASDEADTTISRKFSVRSSSFQQNVVDERLGIRNTSVPSCPNRRSGRKIDHSSVSSSTKNFVPILHDVSKNYSKINVDKEDTSAVIDTIHSIEIDSSDDESSIKFRKSTQTDEGLNKFERFLRRLKVECTIL